MELISVNNDANTSNIVGIANGGTLTGTAANGNASGIFLSQGANVTTGGIVNVSGANISLTSTGGAQTPSLSAAMSSVVSSTVAH